MVAIAFWKNTSYIALEGCFMFLSKCKSKEFLCTVTCVPASILFEYLACLNVNEIFFNTIHIFGHVQKCPRKLLQNSCLWLNNESHGMSTPFYKLSTLEVLKLDHESISCRFMYFTYITYHVGRVLNRTNYNGNLVKSLKF